MIVDIYTANIHDSLACIHGIMVLNISSRRSKQTTFQDKNIGRIRIKMRRGENNKKMSPQNVQTFHLYLKPGQKVGLSFLVVALPCSFGR